MVFILYETECNINSKIQYIIGIFDSVEKIIFTIDSMKKKNKNNPRWTYHYNEFELNKNITEME